ncbi:MAG: N-acetyltransferase family protein [Crocinitomicaceae bacterium]
MSQPPTIRDANETDLKSILAIWNYEILNGTAIFDETSKTLEEITLWWRDRIENGFPVLVLEWEAKVVCYGTYGPFRPKSGYRITVEHSIYSHPESRGKGWGRLVMRELIRLAKEKKLENMIAVIDGSNYKSIRFHQKFGFIECGRMERIGIKFGKHLDIVFMQLQLRD